MKQRLYLSGLSLLCMVGSQGQLIQGTIKPGPSPDKIDVYLKPDFSNTQQYLYQLQFPIAFPATASLPPGRLSVLLDPAFTASFGNNYSVTVYPLSNNTAHTVNYYVVSLIREGEGASHPQTWKSGTEYKVMTVTLPAASRTNEIRLADFQDGGADQQGNFYTVDGNATYYVTSNSIGNFYAAPGESMVEGNANASYVFVSGRRALPDNKKSVTKLTATAYPNPYVQEFKLGIESPVSGKAIIQFYTSTGIKIYEMKQHVLADSPTMAEIKNTTLFKTSVFYKISIGGYKCSGQVLKLE